MNKRVKLIDVITPIEVKKEKELIGLLTQLKSVKPKADVLEKERDEITKKVKELLLELGFNNYNDVEGITTKISVAKSYAFDTDPLIVWLQSNGFDECIKTVEVLDLTKLESLVYNGIIPNSELAKFQIEKKVNKLFIKVL